MVIVFFWQFQPSLKLKFHGEFDELKWKQKMGHHSHTCVRIKEIKAERTENVGGNQNHNEPKAPEKDPTEIWE